MTSMGTEIQQRLESIITHRQQGTAALQRLWSRGELPVASLPCSMNCTGFVGVETNEGYVRGNCPAHMKPDVCPLIEKADRERTARMTHAGFGPHYHQPSLERIRARRAVEEFLARSSVLIGNGRGMVVTGDIGVGKTMMLAYLARQLLDMGHGVWKCHMPKLIEAIQDPKMRHKTVERCLSIEVLMWDDLGSGDMPEEVLGVLERIVEHRYEHHKPMFISTNMTRVELIENVPLRRMVDRWREMNMMVRIAGESQRHA